jgi:plasmid stabilization system protein ParE
MKYIIEFAKAAEEDFIDNATYISNELNNSTAAESLISETQKVAFSLTHMPYRQPLVRDDYLASLGVRMLIVKRYYLFYGVNEDEKIVYIIRQLHSKRNWQNILGLEYLPYMLNEDECDDYDASI